jgi:hypothetical protein
MIEVLPDMPEGVTGIRVSGRLRGDDLREFKPAMEELLKTGEIRIVEVVAPDYEGFGSGGLIEDLKLGLGPDPASFGVQANCGRVRQGLGRPGAARLRLDGPRRARTVRPRRARAGQGVGRRLTTHDA